MREAGIGRVLVASLHQGIADLIPTRLEFYESWLNAKGMRDGTIGMAPFAAVLSFLRQEGEPYDAIMARAGALAAEWTVESMVPLHRSLIRSAPAWLRGRLVLGLVRRLIRKSYKTSRASSRLRRGTATVSVRGSIFCTVREPVPQPLCGFYTAAARRLFTLFNLDANAEVASCRGTGGKNCVLTMGIRPRKAGVAG